MAEDPEDDFVPDLKGDTERQAVLLVYILYFVGFATGVSALAGAVISHMKIETASELWRGHYRYLIRTFWFGFAMLVVGGLTTFLLIGFAIIAWWALWTAVRCIKGLIRALDADPVEDPETLLW